MLVSLVMGQSLLLKFDRWPEVVSDTKFLFPAQKSSPKLQNW